MKRIILPLIFLAIFLHQLWGFPPRDEETFKNNCLRLLSSRQYTVLTEYFVEYYPLFKESDEMEYVEQIVNRIPFADSKEIILKAYINNAVKVNPVAYDLYGQIKLFEKDYEEVVKAYTLYDKVEKYYYLGLAEKEQGNLVDAEKWFLKAIKEIKDKYLVDASYLGLAEIYLKWKDTNKSERALKKVSKNLPEKYILYYYLYREKDNKRLQEVTLKRIKRFKKNYVVEEFLKKEGLE